METTIQDQAQQIQQLETAKPTVDQQRMTRELASERRRERQRARQMLADYSTTIDDLNTLNGSLLTPALQEQLRHNRNAMVANNNIQGIQFDDAAVERINNFRTFSRANPADTFVTNNSPQFPEPLSAFQKWAQRQDSMTGRMQRQQVFQQEQERQLLKAQTSFAENSKPKGKEGGFYIGGVKGLSD